jgi:membrane protease YdiL (CAAX protease family)
VQDLIERIKRNMPSQHSDYRADVRRIALFIACFFAVWSLAVFLVWRPGWYNGKQDDWLQDIVKIVLWLGFSFGAARLAGAKQPFRWMGFYPVAARAVGATALIAAALMLVRDIGRVIWLEGHGPDWHSFFSHLPSACLTGFVEETLFSGAILTWLVACIGPVRGVLVDSTLFFLIHVPGWLILQISPSPEKMAVVMFVGLICETLRQQTGSIWPAIVAHSANNAGAWL